MDRFDVAARSVVTMTMGRWFEGLNTMDRAWMGSNGDRLSDLQERLITAVTVALRTEAGEASNG